MTGVALQVAVPVLAALLVVVVGALLEEAIIEVAITEEVIIATAEVHTSILADTSGFPFMRIHMAITHSATIRMATPIFTPMHIRRILMRIRTIPTPMISQRYTANRNNHIPGIIAEIRKGITRT